MNILPNAPKLREKIAGYFVVSEIWTICAMFALYLGMVNAMDRAIGKVVDELKELDLYENTIIIFSSDVRGTRPTFTIST